jgi:hypothetical protein
VLCLCSFIVARKFGAVGFIFVYFHLYYFFLMLLHCLNICFTIFWYCWIGFLSLFINFLSCLKLFILCFYSPCVNITSVLPLSALVIMSLFF